MQSETCVESEKLSGARNLCSRKCTGESGSWIEIDSGTVLCGHCGAGISYLRGRQRNRWRDVFPRTGEPFEHPATGHPVRGEYPRFLLQVRDPKGASIIGKLNRRVRGCEGSVDEQNASRNPRSDKAARRPGGKGPFQETSSTRLPHLPAGATWAMLSPRHKGLARPQAHEKRRRSPSRGPPFRPGCTMARA